MSGNKTPKNGVTLIKSDILGETIAFVDDSAYTSSELRNLTDERGRYEGAVLYTRSEIAIMKTVKEGDTERPVTAEELRFLHDVKNNFESTVIGSHVSYNRNLKVPDTPIIPAEREVPEKYRKLRELAGRKMLPEVCNVQTAPYEAVSDANLYLSKVFLRPENEQDTRLLEAIHAAYYNAALSLAHIDTGYACFGVVIEQGIVTAAPDISKWSQGKAWQGVKSYYIEKKKAKVTEVFGR